MRPINTRRRPTTRAKFSDNSADRTPEKTPLVEPGEHCGPDPKEKPQRIKEHQ